MTNKAVVTGDTVKNLWQGMTFMTFTERHSQFYHQTNVSVWGLPLWNCYSMPYDRPTAILNTITACK